MEKRNKKRWFLFYPDDKVRKFWDILQTLFILVQATVTPLDLAFPKIREKDFGYSMFLYSIDIFFAIDILMNFITAFENQYEEIIDDRFSIFNNYLTGWFIVDFVSIFPLDFIF